MNFRNRLIAIVLCTVAASMCLAQGGGGGQGRRGGPRGPQNTITGLVNRPDVQADIVLTDDEKTKLTTLRASWGGQGRGQGTRPTPEERAAQNAEREKAVEGILTADQVKRLHEIQIQVMGDEAITLPDVQTSIGLSDDQKGQVKDLQKQYSDANRSIQEKVRNGDEQQQDATGDFQKNRQTMKDNLHKVLKPDQIDKLKALGGTKPFVATPVPGSAK